jgi:hypothetical protein
MASEGYIPKRPIRISELQTLADRLQKRSISKLTEDQPEQKADLALAAKALRALIRSFNWSDTLLLENGNGG